MAASAADAHLLAKSVTESPDPCAAVLAAEAGIPADAALRQTLMAEVGTSGARVSTVAHLALRQIPADSQQAAARSPLAADGMLRAGELGAGSPAAAAAWVGAEVVAVADVLLRSAGTPCRSGGIDYCAWGVGARARQRSAATCPKGLGNQQMQHAGCAFVPCFARLLLPLSLQMNAAAQRACARPWLALEAVAARTRCVQ